MDEEWLAHVILERARHRGLDLVDRLRCRFGLERNFWNHERFNTLLVVARSEQNDNRRHEMYVELQQILHDEGGAVIPLFASHLAATRDNVAIPDELIPAWGMDGAKATERWWFS